VEITNRSLRLPGIGRQALETVAPLAIIAIAIVFVPLDGGYSTTTWYAGGILAGGLLVVQLLGGGVNLTAGPATLAAAALACFGGIQLLSITWAHAKGDAWDAGNLTFVYAIVLLLFAGFRGGVRARQALTALVVVAMAALGVATLFSSSHDISGAFTADRLAAPTGYPNATAALFLLPFWAGVALAGAPRLPVALRGVMLGSAAALAVVAYVPESRGALYIFPIAAALLILLARHRLRTTVALLVAIAPTALLIPALSRPYEAADRAHRAAATHHAAVLAILAAGAVAVIGTLLAVGDNHVRIGPSRRLQVVTRALAALTILILAGWLATTHPGAHASRLWTSFRSDTSEQPDGTRFGTLGSNRYDFWRVSLDLTRESPLIGVGAGNFGERYLEHRRSGEQPAYPHSIEMSVLSETGALGTAAFLVFIVAAAVGLAAARRRGSAEASVAAGAGTAFAYWMLHGSVDWLWQFPALGLTALLLLGLAIAPPTGPPRRPRRFVAAATAIVGLSFFLPWIAARQVAEASGAWQQDPGSADATLGQAFKINPLSDAAAVVAGTIAAQRGEVDRMRLRFEQATSRDSHNWFAQTELAIALAHEGRWGPATRAASAAAALNPREEIARTVLASIRKRRPPALDFVNKAVLLELQALPGIRR
jgi:hypothetical protein